MAYDFQKLADVELLEEVPDGASAFVAVDGVVKRVPGSGLGGGGVATAILRLSSESNASTNAAKLPITCDNYTYAQARAVLEAGNPFAAILYMVDGDMSGWTSSFSVALSADSIAMGFVIKMNKVIHWNADGFSTRE